MGNARFAAVAAGIALAAGLLSGCSSSPPEERVAVVTPSVVTVPAATPQAQAQTYRATIGMTPTDTQGVMRLQSFAGDVCVHDGSGTPTLSHCVCEQTNCNCQSTGTACNP